MKTLRILLAALVFSGPAFADTNYVAYRLNSGRIAAYGPGYDYNLDQDRLSVGSASFVGGVTNAMGVLSTTSPITDRTKNISELSSATPVDLTTDDHKTFTGSKDTDKAFKAWLSLYNDTVGPTNKITWGDLKKEIKK